MDAPDNLKTQGERLGYVIAATGLRQIALAERIGYTESHLSAVKTGREKVSLRMALSIERVLGFRANWLMEGEGAPRVDEDGPEDAVFLPAVDVDTLGLPLVDNQTRPVKVTVYQCGICRMMLFPNIPRCPHCGARVKWGRK